MKLYVNLSRIIYEGINIGGKSVDSEIVISCGTEAETEAERTANDEIELLIEKYGNTVFQLALAKTKNKETAEDIFQEVFMKLIKNKKVFENGDHEKAWIIRVTLNCCKDLWSSAWFRHMVPLEEYQENLNISDSNGKTKKFDGEENFCMDIVADNNEDVYAAVMNLPEKYRIPVHLFYYEELSVSDIAMIMKTNKNTISTRLKRAREILKKTLYEGGIYDGL